MAQKLSIIGVIVFVMTASSPAKSIPVSAQEEKQWILHVIPLPHEVSIDSKVTVKCGDIKLTLRPRAGDIEENAFSELKTLFKEKTGKIPNGNKFEIIVGVTDKQNKVAGYNVEQSCRLKKLPNNKQAYIIQPVGDDKLLVTGLDEVGVFYGIQTLMQLIKPKLTEKKVTIPLAKIVDWPDMDERGLWNMYRHFEWIPWMSEIKLNYANMPVNFHKVVRGKPNHVTIKVDLMNKFKLRGFRYVPQITHLNFLHRYDLFKAYPELAGKGDSALAGRYFAHKLGIQHRAPFAAHPKFIDILYEWMMDMARQGADDICCWLSERPVQDAREETAEVGQFVLEARAFVKAWRRVQKTYPDVKIRLFLSTTTPQRDYRILAEIPKDVKIIRCCITEYERVQHLPRDLYRSPLLDSYAEQGYWIGTYDVPINASGKVETPEFKLPMRSAHRLRDFVTQMAKRGYQGASGMLAWGNHVQTNCEFNITALAEWSWNANGRNEHDFALAYAMRKGMNDPEKVAQWSDIMGPISFDVYDSKFPIGYSWGLAADMVKNKQRPYLGEGIFRYYTSKEAFDAKLAACDKALKIARDIEVPHFANETRVVQSYVDLARCIWQVALLTSTDEFETMQSQAKLKKLLDELDTAGKKNVAAITHWRSTIGPKPWHQRVTDAIKSTEDTVSVITRYLQGRYFY